MPFFQRKKKAYLNLERGRKSEYNRQYYILNCERVKARSRTLTKHSPIRKRQPSDFPKEPSLIRKRWPSEIPNRSHLEICNRLQISQIVEPSHKKVVTVLGRNKKLTVNFSWATSQTYTCLTCTALHVHAHMMHLSGLKSIPEATHPVP